MQYNVEVAYKEKEINSWDRKEIINEILEELKNRLFNLPTSNLASLLKILDKNINEKNIQIYFADKNWETLISQLGADGKIKETGGDYLMVVDANLAAYKSDAVMDKTISYTLDPINFTSSLKLSYAHQGGFDWRTTRYRTYTRIYAPLGSELISISGIDKEQNDFSIINDTVLDKTVFGFFFSIEPSESREISISYKLPAGLINTLNKKGQYNLYWQKQAGNKTKANLSVAGKSSKWQGELITDRSFLIDLNR